MVTVLPLYSNQFSPPRLLQRELAASPVVPAPEAAAMAPKPHKTVRQPRPSERDQLARRHEERKTMRDVAREFCISRTTAAKP